MFVSAIIAAGGAGGRIGARVPKQLLDIDGQSMLARSLTAFDTHPRVSEVIVVLPAELVGDEKRYVGVTTRPVRAVNGGPRRQDSVARGFDLVSTQADVVLVHDAARPFVSAALIDRTIEGAAAYGAAIPAVRARDTAKRARAAMIVETIPRDSIFLAQTPQAFRRELLREALALADREDVDATDEAMLVERTGHVVRIVEGEASNIKITTPDDLVLAEAIARNLSDVARGSTRAMETDVARGFSRAGPPRTGRAGTGYDLHRLIDGRPLVLGGIAIPSARGALGHSDADVICHAVIDAILGAAGLGDIGVHFPDSEPRWEGASSLGMLAHAASLALEAGYEVGNIDVTVILEAPKLRDHIAAMREAVARAVGIEPARVSIKGKTNEGLDAIGRGEAIAAHAIALIRSRADRA
jgi:2-C-methyl-D-erythritol 4-phosphate cytidylyltransferase/2-C-methyl-D-erythritol 2,4-cyclodiphosphate synthase